MKDVANKVWRQHLHETPVFTPPQRSIFRCCQKGEHCDLYQDISLGSFLKCNLSDLLKSGELFYIPEVPLLLLHVEVKGILDFA